MKTIKIKKELHKKFKAHTNLLSDLYLLGANEEGVIVDKVKLKKSGGCEYMPRIIGSVLTAAYVRLTKKGLIPVGFANLLDYTAINRLYYCSSRLYRGGWGYVFGSALRENPGMIFIVYDKKKIGVLVTDKKRRVHRLKLKAV